MKFLVIAVLVAFAGITTATPVEGAGVDTSQTTVLLKPILTCIKNLDSSLLANLTDDVKELGNLVGGGKYLRKNQASAKCVFKITNK